MNASMEIFKICPVSLPINMMPLKSIIILHVLNWHSYILSLSLIYLLFSFLWAAWKAEETISTEVNIQRLYENPESQCPVDKPQGGGIFYICWFFPHMHEFYDLFSLNWSF